MSKIDLLTVLNTADEVRKKKLLRKAVDAVIASRKESNLNKLLHMQETTKHNRIRRAIKLGIIKVDVN